MASWRRTLTPLEMAACQSFLAAHPAARAKWDEETNLSELLAKLPDAPLSSNFTSRVMQIVERERPARSGKESIFARLKFNWPRIAVASALAVAAVFSMNQYRVAQRTEIAHDIVAVSQVAIVPQEWLQDFDAINRLSRPPVDDELLAALQ
ncbi:MAG: hypothetical protein ABIQ35_03745 [Verrucomicrobiota bacterium]